MNYSASGCLISSGISACSPQTLEHHLTVNAQWDKQEVLKKTCALNSQYNPLTTTPPRPDLSQDQYTAAARCCTTPHRGRTCSKRNPPEEVCACIYKLNSLTRSTNVCRKIVFFTELRTVIQGFTQFILRASLLTEQDVRRRNALWSNAAIYWLNPAIRTF